MSFRITTKDAGAISGLKRISDMLKNAPAGVLEEGAKQGLEHAQSVVPVRTGYLRSTLYKEVRSDSVVLGGKADYTVPVEFGNRGRPARPFLRPGIEVAYKYILANLGKGLGL